MGNLYAIACEDKYLSIAPYFGVERVATIAEASHYGELQVKRLQSLIRLLPDGSHIVKVES
jgi:hypothetical protein